MSTTILDLAIVAALPIGMVAATFIYGRKHQRWTDARRSAVETVEQSIHVRDPPLDGFGRHVVEQPDLGVRQTLDPALQENIPSSRL